MNLAGCAARRGAESSRPSAPRQELWQSVTPGEPAMSRNLFTER